MCGYGQLVQGSEDSDVGLFWEVVHQAYSSILDELQRPAGRGKQRAAVVKPGEDLSWNHKLI